MEAPRHNRRRGSEVPAFRFRRGSAASIVLAAALLVANPPVSRAQACCSAGTPLLDALELGAGRPGVLQVNAGYVHNSLRSVVGGSEEFPNDAGRERSTRSVTIETNYGLSRRVSLSALASFVVRERISVLQQSGGRERTTAAGVSDGILLVTYAAIVPTVVTRFELAAGAGLKLPLGSTAARSGGILLAADMQPGTGSWDGILRLHGSASLRPLPAAVFASFTARLTGTNAGGYEFGDELQGTAGASWSFSSMIDVTLQGRFRHRSADRFENRRLPNTGGIWLDLAPGVNFTPVRALTFRASLELPVHRSLQGSQLTTTVAGGVSLLASIPIGKEAGS